MKPLAMPPTPFVHIIFHTRSMLVTTSTAKGYTHSLLVEATVIVTDLNGYQTGGEKKSKHR